MTKKTILLAVVLSTFGFMGLQLFRPHFDNMPLDSQLTAKNLGIPQPLHQILQLSCFDCHSNSTKLRWFDQVMPAYALVVKDVEDGRRHLNFSNWENLSEKERKGKWFVVINQVLNDGMPLSNYLLLHRDAKITPEDQLVFKKFVGPMVLRAVLDQQESNKKIAEADLDYKNLLSLSASSSEKSRVVEPEFNGVAYDPHYSDWSVLNATDRLDNATTRIVFGNSIAVKAIQEKKVEQTITRWPDGTRIAKVAWNSLARPDGLIHAGTFFQVEMMVKDSKKYESTLGWGFGRWRGNDLKPYGKDSHFEKECVTCHLPMKNRDFVYSDTSEFRDDRVGYSFVSSFVDPLQHTMSTLYAKGGERILDSYRAVPDARWFGASVPSHLVATEKSNGDPNKTSNPLLTHRSSSLPR